MTKMKLFAWRVTVIHTCVVASIVISTCMLNYLVWSYIPDSRFETLETLLLPYAKFVFTLVTASLALTVAFDSHTVRVIGKLSHYRKSYPELR